MRIGPIPMINKIFSIHTREWECVGDILVCTKSPTILLFHYMKTLSKINKIKAFYIEMIGSPTTLTTSVQNSQNFGPSSSSKNDTETIQVVILDHCVQQNTIWKWYGIIWHKTDTCIIRIPNFLPPILRRNMNQFNYLHGYEPYK